MIAGIAFLVASVFIFWHFSGIASKFKKNRVGFGFLGIGFLTVNYFFIAFLAGIIVDALGIYMLQGLMAMVVLKLLILGLTIAVVAIIGKLFKIAWAD